KRAWTMRDYTVKLVNGMHEKWINGLGLKKDTVLDMRPTDFIAIDNQFTAMPTSDLSRDIEKEKLRGTGQLKEMRYDYYQRFIYAFSAYVLTLIGVSIS